MDSFVTMSDIARIANVTRQAVTNWRSRTTHCCRFLPPPGLLPGSSSLIAMRFLTGWRRRVGASTRMPGSTPRQSLCRMTFVSRTRSSCSRFGPA